MANSRSRKNKKKAGELKLPPQYSNLYVETPHNNYVRLPAPAQAKPITRRATPRTRRAPLQAPKTPRSKSRATTQRTTPTPIKTGKSKKSFKNLPELLKIFRRLRPGSKNKTVRV